MIAVLGSQPSTRAARLPIAALLLCNWAAEHWLLNRFERCASYLTQYRRICRWNIWDVEQLTVSCNWFPWRQYIKPGLTCCNAQMCLRLLNFTMCQHAASQQDS